MKESCTTLRRLANNSILYFTHKVTKCSQIWELNENIKNVLCIFEPLIDNNQPWILLARVLTAVSATHHSVLQCMSGTETWQRVNTGMPVKSPRFALFDLAEDRSYRFRVRCCNSAGVSEASVTTEEITVGDKLGGT